jgi:multicomponent Na+:H+ antiporter subunit C
MTLYLLCTILFLIGVYCVVTKRNLIKIIIGIGISEYALNLFLVLLGYRTGGRAPVFSETQAVGNMVDPLPQALVLTSIVIGLGVTSLLIALAIRLYEKYGTFDITRMRRLRG